MIEIIKLFTLTLISTFVAGQIFRAMYRFKYCQPVLDYKLNCCVGCQKRFRFVELLPIFGTILTMIKCDGHENNKAKVALLIETNCFFIVPILYLFVYSLVFQLFIFVAIIVLLSGVLLSEGDNTEVA